MKKISIAAGILLLVIILLVYATLGQKPEWPTYNWQNTECWEMDLVNNDIMGGTP